MKGGWGSWGVGAVTVGSFGMLVTIGFTVGFWTIEGMTAGTWGDIGGDIGGDAGGDIVRADVLSGFRSVSFGSFPKLTAGVFSCSSLKLTRCFPLRSYVPKLLLLSSLTASEMILGGPLPPFIALFIGYRCAGILVLAGNCE